MSTFAIIRLGKDSVADIRTLDALHQSPSHPVKLTVHCAQVPSELAAGDYVFLCLGSDNNKGIPTAWSRGVRAFGTVVEKNGGPGYNDPWNVSVEIRVVLPASIAHKDLLAKSPTAYYWCSDIPVLGVDTHSNQTVQMIKDQEPLQNVAALAHALASIFPAFRSDTIGAYPALRALFDYQPPTPGVTEDSFADDASILGESSLDDLLRRFAADARQAQLRVDLVGAHRLAACLLAKRFLIATGLAGSGKTKLAQAFARWLTPRALSFDPFAPGSTLKGAQNEYTVVEANDGIVKLESADGTLVPLPRTIIEEWADYIVTNDVPESVSGRELRDQVEAQSKVIGYLHRLESHYKPAAFALVAARKATYAAKCYEVIPVGADWTGNENVLGYPNGLDERSYVTKPALDLFLRAKEHSDVPHFLILDEMNLSHVERYFSDILSAIESEEQVPLHHGGERRAGDRAVPLKLALPDNVFIIGTVNVDETTYMFSPKVLDRANVIEFRMAPKELEAFLADPARVDLSKLDGRGADFGKAFVQAARSAADVPADVKVYWEQEMMLFFTALQWHGAEFGYRVGHESARFMHFYKLLGSYPDGDSSWCPAAFDCLVVQKLLPKLHGSRARLGPLLKKLWFLCKNDVAARGADVLQAAEEAARSADKSAEPSTAPEVLAGAHYPLSAEKIARMWRLLNENGFVSFAEA